MTWQQLSTRAILATGAVGYLVAFWQVASMLAWLGRRGVGWPRILIRALVALLALLAFLFGLSLAGDLGWTRHLPRPVGLALAYGTVGGLSAAPWGIGLALHRWWRARREGID